MSIFSSAEIDYFKTLITVAGQKALSIQRTRPAVTRKSDSTIVTEADTLVQDYVTSEIVKKYPEINFICEEISTELKKDINKDTISAIIDPIDGTAVYSMRLPTWCVSIGILKGFEPVYGFVYSPGCGMLFHNDDNHTYLNDEIIRADANLKIDSETNIFTAAEIQKLFNIKFPGKLRNIGSTALHACLCTDNEVNRTVAFLGRSYLWDWAAAFSILRNSGAGYKYFSGKEIDIEEVIKNGNKLTDYVLAYSGVDFDTARNFFKPIT
jgi:myo-inositol-1(or 4)-monophosphatase